MRRDVFSNSKFTRIKELIQLAKSLGIEEPWFLNGLEQLSIRWNERLYRLLLHRCRQNIGPVLQTVFPTPKSKSDLEAIDGPFKIGRIAYTHINYGLRPQQLRLHSVVGGASGYGKSTLIKILTQQMIDPMIGEGNIKVWLIDPKEGGDYRFLAQQFENVVVLRPDILKCNPFTHIENVPTEMLREAVSEVTADSFGLFDAGESLISKNLQLVFEKHEQPTFLDFIASIRKEKAKFGGRKQGYLDSIETRLDKIESSQGKIIDCKKDYFSQLYDKNVVIEVGELSGSAQRVLVPWIILKLVLYKIKNPTSNLSHLLIFDEAQSQIWSKNLEVRGRTSFTAQLATQCRAYGLGIIVLAQNPAMKLMTEIIANSCIKICFHLGSGMEIQTMSQHMGLTPEQRDMLHHLDRGEAILRVGLGYTEPVLLEVSDFDDKPVSNDELADLMKPHWDELLATVEPVDAEEQEQIPPKTSKKEESVPTAEVSDTSEDELKNATAESKPSKTLPEDEQAYLRIVKTHPWCLITEVYALLNDKKVMGTDCISQSRAVKIRQKLIKKGYLESFTVLGTGRSGRAQCDVPTEKAGKVYKPRGGYLHGFWASRVGEFYCSKGATVKIGDSSTGSEIDVDVTMEDGKRIGCEVVITELVVDNLAKHISYFDEILILCVDDKKKKAIERLLENSEDDIQEKITIGLLKKYFISL